LFLHARVFCFALVTPFPSNVASSSLADDGNAGKALTIDSASSKPWYVYLAGMAVIIILLKIAGDVASSVIDSMEDEAGEGWDGDAGIL